MPDAETEPPDPPPRDEPGFDGLDPGELLARALDAGKSSGGAAGWIPPEPGDLASLLPQYRVQRLIGRGGMGAVYQGIQPELERPVAIKLLPAEVAADEEFVTRFKREARTLARLQHSRIITIHDFGQTSAGHLYFVMEYIDGTDLRSILNGPGLNSEQTLLVVSQICDALYAAHALGVIHRDIKPENVLITRDGYVKLADFGLARPAEARDSAITRTDLVLGTPAYMAPEQHRGTTDPRSDIFALGVMLYEMLTGRTPQGIFDLPSRKVEVDVRIDEVVVKALQQEPERRYQHASEMKTDVDRIRTTPMEKAGSGKRKAEAKASRVQAAGIIAAGVILAGATGFVIWQRFGASPAARPQAGAAESSSALQRVEASKTPGGADGLKSSTTLATVTKYAPFVNSLGMKFVSVPNTHVLFSIWETRVGDFGVFVKNIKEKPFWHELKVGNALAFPGDYYPIGYVTREGASYFCNWLTETETASGILPKGARYRLPTDLEWSAAVGLDQEQGMTPQDRAANAEDVYPWGGDFPPRAKVGNFRDVNFQKMVPSERGDPIPGYDAGFATTAPVGSFQPNHLGIYDLSGNVAEWCADDYAPGDKRCVVRGGSFFDADPKDLRSAQRVAWKWANTRWWHIGFRCVIDFSAAQNQAKPPSQKP